MEKDSVRLVKIDCSNREAVAALTKNPDGVPTPEEEFVTSNARSLLEAQYEGGWTPRGVEAAGRLVGFVMYGWNAEEHFYEISRLMIDRRYQGQGCGRKALRLAVEDLKKTPGIREIFLSAEPENQRALALYESEGFADTGRILAGERLLVLKLTEPE